MRTDTHTHTHTPVDLWTAPRWTRSAQRSMQLGQCLYFNWAKSPIYAVNWRPQWGHVSAGSPVSGEVRSLRQRCFSFTCSAQVASASIALLCRKAQYLDRFIAACSQVSAVVPKAFAWWCPWSAVLVHLPVWRHESAGRTGAVLVAGCLASTPHAPPTAVETCVSQFLLTVGVHSLERWCWCASLTSGCVRWCGDISAGSVLVE